MKVSQPQKQKMLEVNSGKLAIEKWRSIPAVATRWMSVDVSIATLRSAVGSMSVVCQ